MTQGKDNFVGMDITKVWFRKVMEQVSIDPREFEPIYIVYYEGVELGRAMDPEQWIQEHDVR